MGTKLKENQKKIEELRGKLNEVSKKLRKKFNNYIVSVGLLPAARITYLDREAKKINLIVIVNDRDRKRLSRDELKDKVSNIVNKLASEVDESIEPETILLSELWYNCLYRNYKVVEVLQTVAPIYDNGLLSGIKNAHLHNKMINEKFDSFVSTYLLLGDLVDGSPSQGKKGSKIDVGIIIDDSGVRDMGSSELKDKLKIIAASKSMESGDLIGNKSELHPRVFLITELWENLKDGDTWAIQMLRKGVPIKDNGTFLCWKQLLEKGKFQPDLDSLRSMIKSGGEKIYRVKNELYEGTINNLYSTLMETSQSVLMHHDVFCEDSEVIEKLHELMVKSKILERPYLDTLVRLNDYHRDLREGKELRINAKVVEELISDSEKFINKMSRVY